MNESLTIFSPGGRVIEYPPRFDICYGDLVRLRNIAQQRGEEQIAIELTERIRNFFNKQMSINLE